MNLNARGMLMAAFAVLTSTTVALGEDRVVFSFDNADARSKWQAVNDGVMGGRSDGRFRINGSGSMEFYGTLSLANNGGFASVRSRGASLGLAAGDAIVVRVRGDGRVYGLNLYTPARRTAFSYRREFETRAGEWITVRLPLKDFVATWFGRVQPNEKLSPSQVSGIGILLGDKKAGPFKLEVDWIAVSRPSK